MFHYKGFPTEVGAWLEEVSLHEAPAIYTRWAALSVVASVTERKVYMPYMSSKVFPNQYILFVGPPASRKSTVIEQAVDMLKDAGHRAFCPVDLTKSSLLRTLVKGTHIRNQTSSHSQVADLFEEADEDALDNLNFDELIQQGNDTVSPLTAISHELQTLLPQQAGQILSVLQDLWDSPNEYPTRTGTIHKAFINLLCGLNTETLPVVLEQKKLLNGLMSRLVFVHGASTGRTRDAFEVAAGLKTAGMLDSHQDMVGLLQKVRTMEGAMTITPEARELFSAISSGIPRSVAAADARFNLYAERRVNHLLKMAMAHALARLSMEISEDDIKYCHTLLCYTESYMPEALGEYGYVKEGQGYKAILDALTENTAGLNMQQLQKKVSFYLSDANTLADALTNLHAAGLIEEAGAMKGMDSESGSMASHIWVRKPSDLRKWKPFFGTLVFPEMMHEWKMLTEV